MVYSESIEMYLETVYILEKEYGHATGVGIAKHLGVSKPSVTKAMTQLKTKGLIHKEAYGNVTLTPLGLELSKKVYYRHKLITEFLIHTLGVTEKEASKNACKMEHVLSSELIEAITHYLEKHSVDIG